MPVCWYSFFCGTHHRHTEELEKISVPLYPYGWFYILNFLTPSINFLTRSSYPTSSRYSLPLFLMTAKRVREEAEEEKTEA